MHSQIPHFAKNKYRISKTWVNPPLPAGENFLVQIGMTFFNDSTYIEPHTHENYYELTVIKEGHGTILVNNVPVPVQKNDICLTMPYDRHEIVSSKDDFLQIINVGFVVAKDSLVQEYNRIYQDFHDADLRLFTNNIVVYLLGLLLNEIQQGNENSALIGPLMESIALYVVKSFNHKEGASRTEHITNHEILCYQIMNYIDTNILAIESLSEIADMTHYTYPYLSALFKKITKTTICDYYANAKFEKARALLEEGHVSVHKVAEMFHYTTSNAFTKAYKNWFGVPPSQDKNSNS